MLTTDEHCPCWESLLSDSLCCTCLKRIQKSLIPRSVSYQLEELHLCSMSTYDLCMKEFIFSCKSASFNGLMPSQKKILKDLCSYWAKELAHKRIEKIVPIPAHPVRSLLQSDLAWFLARYLSKNLKVGEVESLLKRKVFVKGNLYSPQKSLSALKRKEKISEQYFVPKNKSNNLRVFLVDDVCTTGSTLKYCKKILEDAGYNVLGAIVLSKVTENKKTGAPFQELR